MPLPLALQFGAAVVIVAIGWAGSARCSRRRVPALLHLGADRRITVTDRRGRTQDGAILDDSFVGARLATIVWRPDGARWWQPAGTIVVIADMLPGDDFRRLRVLLRYGRPASTAGSNDVAAG
ncbi:MAG: hypothetical protein ABI886_14125 [Betaproteobacteria bacterium]